VDKGLTDQFVPTGQIVEDVMMENMEAAALPKQENLRRTVNRKRQQTRPKHPTDLEFEVEYGIKFHLSFDSFI
jgi:hypothetical protein